MKIKNLNVEESNAEKLKRGKFKLIGALFGLGVTAAVGTKTFDVVRDNNMEKEVVDDQVGSMVNGEIVYDRADLDKMYFADIRTDDGYLDYCYVKELEFNDYASYDAKRNVAVTNCEKYLGATAKDLGYSKEDIAAGKFKLYVNPLTDELVSVVNFSDPTMGIEECSKYWNQYYVSNEKFDFSISSFANIGNIYRGLDYIDFPSDIQQMTQSELSKAKDAIFEKDGLERTPIPENEKSR